MKTGPAFLLLALILAYPLSQAWRTHRTPAPAPLIAWSNTAVSQQGPTVQASPQTATPPAALPPIQARVGLQVGHWETANLPDELAALRNEPGAQTPGLNEVDVNYAIARRVAALLTARGITVDLIPATVPPGYTAQAFVAIHSDYNQQPAMNGYKITRFRDSAIPARDDALIAALSTEYPAVTGQQRDPYITRAMTGYYAFNSGAFQHTINPQTPGVIMEMGFLTNPTERNLFTDHQDTVATGIANGIIRFLTTP